VWADHFEGRAVAEGEVDVHAAVVDARPPAVDRHDAGAH
jgi:hypothetical protein